MIRTKLGLLGLCAAALGMMAMSANSAQASLYKWLILNAAHTTATELKAALVGEAESDLTLVTHLLGRLFWVTCTGFKLENVNLEALGTLTTGGQVLFTECEAYGTGPLTEPLFCNVHSPGTPPSSKTIKTNKEKGALLLHEYEAGKTELVAKLEPEVGQALGTIFTEECIMPESNPVRGQLFIKDGLKQAEVHKVSHLVETLKTLTKLWVGVHSEEHLKTEIEGSAWVGLANSASGEHSGLDWAGIHNKP
jgi:hypothetical protein